MCSVRSTVRVVDLEEAPFKLPLSIAAEGAVLCQDHDIKKAVPSLFPRFVKAYIYIYLVHLYILHTYVSYLSVYMISHTTSIHNQDFILPPFTYSTQYNNHSDKMDNSKSAAAGTAQQSTTTTGTRRGSGPSYEGLMNYKRSNDPSSVARRASLHEQGPPPGFFGSMWHNFTRGSTSPTK
ncbi:hypothetical protein GGS20DRAFT_531625 [Poronia punctata]|nr:hypothetical protein GGS20DRAFT_531625 [Poronia punctata]